jgi:DNA-directed RNA polymerase beta subunit
MVSCIIPDNCRPYYIDADGNKQYADIILNSASIIGRKNASQLLEVLLARAVSKIYEMAKKANSDEELNEVLNLVKEVYGEQHKDLDLDGLKAMRDSGLTAFKIYVGSFHEKAYQYVKDIADKLGITETEEVYTPSVSIHENKDYSKETKNIGLEVRCIEDENGDIDDSLRFSDGTDYELGWLDQQLLVGTSYFYKLYHSAVWSGSVTPTRDNVAVTTLGKGKIRKTGQSIGEMESWALQATGASELYQDPVRSPSYESSQYEFINALLRGGYELN